LTVTSGCDPVSIAALGGPFDLQAGAGRTLHLRIRLADLPATKPLPADYYLDATPAGNIDAQGSLSGRFLIQPRQPPTAGQGSAKPTTTTKAAAVGGPTASPTAPTSQPDVSTGMPVDAASRLPDQRDHSRGATVDRYARGETFTLTTLNIRLLSDGQLAARAYGRPNGGGRGTYVSFAVPDKPELAALIFDAADRAGCLWASHGGIR
jgi:hypothetical protein